MPKYDSGAITVLPDNDHIRRRPGMYIGSTDVRGLHHLTHELIYNSVDQAMAGVCDEIVVELLADGGCRVSDNGPGISVDKIPGIDKTFLELAMTRRVNGDPHQRPPYKVGYRLAGIGLQAVNGLSARLVVECARNGQLWRQEYQRGQPVTSLQPVRLIEHSGTSITFWPDPEIFTGGLEFNFDLLMEHAQEFPFLNKGLSICVVDRRRMRDEGDVFLYPEGINDFLRQLTRGREPVHPTIFYFKETAENHEVEVAAQWMKDLDTEQVRAYANKSFVSQGGTHQTGFRRSLTRTISSWCKAKGLTTTAPVTGEDCRAALVAIIAAQVREPQFYGATKSRLANPEVQSFVQVSMNKALSAFLKENKQDADAICRHILSAQQHRLRGKGTPKLSPTAVTP